MKEKGARGLVMTLFLFPMDRIKPLQKWSLEEKNQFSHRAKATEKLVAFLSIYPCKHTLNQNLKIELTKQPKYHRKRLNQWMH